MEPFHIIVFVTDGEQIARDTHRPDYPGKGSCKTKGGKKTGKKTKRLEENQMARLSGRRG